MKQEITSQAMKASPPIAVVAATTVAGMTLQDWVFIATLGYLALQSGYLLWKWYRAANTKGWRPSDGD